MRAKVFSALLLFWCATCICRAQASPYNLFVFPAQSFTATNQTGATIQLNGLTQPNSTVGSSYTSGNLTITGSGLTTATIGVLGSADNGGTFFPLLLSPITAPGTTSATVTVTANGIYQINLAGITHVKFVTSGTFTAANVSIVLSATPNGLISRSAGGSGGVPSVFGRTGAVVAAPNDYSFSQLSGSPSTAQLAGAGTLSNNVTTLLGVVYSGSPGARLIPIATDATHGAFGQLTQDDILPGFTITGFSGGQNVEIGATVTNPAFTASYSSLPASAAITNTDSIDSPLNLTTPFTSGTVVGSFHKTFSVSTTFTLTAVGAVTRTSTQNINWISRTFGGVGAAGATSSVTASGSTAVLSNGAVLADAGLSNSQVGQTYGAFSPSGQKIYILMIGGSHTFKDPSTGFSFAFNTPTAVSFTNQNGATVSMFLYESSNTLTGSFSVLVAS